MTIAIIWLVAVALILFWNYAAHKKSKEYEENNNQ